MLNKTFTFELYLIMRLLFVDLRLILKNSLKLKTKNQLIEFLNETSIRYVILGPNAKVDV